MVDAGAVSQKDSQEVKHLPQPLGRSLDEDILVWYMLHYHYIIVEFKSLMSYMLCTIYTKPFEAKHIAHLQYHQPPAALLLQDPKPIMWNFFGTWENTVVLDHLGLHLC